MIISYAKGWAKTLDLNGKTNRKEFWAFVSIDLLVSSILYGYFIDSFEQYGHTFLPNLLFPILTVFVGSITRISILGRRIRDTGRTSKWMFWIFIPALGWVILTLLALQPTYSSNRDALQVKVVGNLNEENSDKKTNEQSLQSKLEELKRLKKEGLVSEEEYEKMRKNTLGL